ncbi:hypothetical protein [Psychrobacillus antarcticus]|uniref:hypothetical protein n=1 Tax=Psychrobacillus antarcticus TaxID=2879115 RepID=UPI00240790B4|nr:hypothetical protein [Psychrobacillus antarcticus]
MIVIPTWFSGISKDYETYIGVDRALNPNEYFMFFPVRDCEAEQKLIPNSELKVINSICGHFGLFGGDGADYHNQIDAYLNELLAINVVEAV